MYQSSAAVEARMRTIAAVSRRCEVSPRFAALERSALAFSVAVASRFAIRSCAILASSRRSCASTLTDALARCNALNGIAALLGSVAPLPCR